MSGEVVELQYDAMGTEGANPVLLLHGFPLSRATWMPVLPHLSSDLRVVAPDLRGHGASPAAEAPWGMDDVARDLLALADRLGFERFDLAGHSMGGYVAFALLRLQPRRVRRLALVATRATPDSPGAKTAREKQIELLHREGVSAFASTLVPKLTAPGTDALLLEEVRRIVEGNRVSGLEEALRAMAARPDATGMLPEIAQPTLVLTGAEDQVMPRAEQDRLAREIPNARQEVLSASGHLPMMEAPQKTASVLLAHFNG